MFQLDTEGETVVHAAQSADGDQHIATSPTWEKVVQGLWLRVTGGTHPIRLRHLSTGTRSFEIRSDGRTLFVAATDPVSAAVAIHTYLRRSCGHAIHWDTVLPIFLTELPSSEIVRDCAGVDEFYYLNFCTGSYSTAYWGWGEWEREVDWMALHGITMPLQTVGHEATLQSVLIRHGLSSEEIQEFLGGPGYLPFVYMGCIDSFGGALPQSWIDAHARLGRQILEREREFGMTPVLPAFTGHVPAAIAPQETTERWWQGMKTRVLPPTSDLFSRLTSDIVTAQQDLFGTDHLYASDPFIEMVPADTNVSAEYPSAVARALIDGLTTADSEARWVLQSWPFSYQRDYWTTARVKEFVAVVPDSRLLLLDLWAEADPQSARLDGFFGHSWMWNGLLNFGGRGDLIAGLPDTDRRIEQALSASRPPTGLGLAMEATQISPVFYELVADRAWTTRTEPLEQWIREFGRQRYALDDPRAGETWANLLNSVLSATSRDIFPGGFIATAILRPTFALLDKRAGIHAEIENALFYDPRELLDAWSGLHQLSIEYSDRTNGPLGADLVQVGTTVLLRLIDFRLRDILRAARCGNVPSADSITEFLDLFDSLDELASTRDQLTMQGWEASAAAWASSTAEESIYRDNSRRIVTVWNTVDNPSLDDYSARLWTGLVSGYYKKRWESWLELLPEALDIEKREAAQARLNEILAQRSKTFLSAGAFPRTSTQRDVAEISGLQIDRFASDFISLRQSQSTTKRPRRPA